MILELDVKVPNVFRPIVVLHVGEMADFMAKHLVYSIVS